MGTTSSGELLHLPCAEYTFGSAGQIIVVETCSPVSPGDNHALETPGFADLPMAVMWGWAQKLATYRRGAWRTPAWLFRRMVDSPGFYVAFTPAHTPQPLAFADVRQPSPEKRHDQRVTLDEFEIVWRAGEELALDELEQRGDPDEEYITWTMSDWAPPRVIRAASAVLLRTVESRRGDTIVSVVCHKNDVRSEAGALREFGLRPRLGRRWPTGGARLEASAMRINESIDSFTDIEF